jgi:DNA-binding response OmpR family regulator
MKTLLLVEDERDLLQNNKRLFEENGYAVLSAETLSEARVHLKQNNPNAVVLDITLPDGSGLNLLCELRESGNDIPVLLLAEWDKPRNIAEGFRAGANGYLPKPFDYDVLLARMEAMLRGAERVPSVVAKGALKLDVTAGEAFVNGADLMLTPKQFSLLLHFVQHEGQTLSAEDIYNRIWRRPMAGDSGALRSAASQLRKKLSGSGYTVVAEYGDGYRFEWE